MNIYPTEYNKATEEQWRDLYENPNDYRVSVRGTEWKTTYDKATDIDDGTSTVFGEFGKDSADCLWLHLFEEQFLVQLYAGNPITGEIHECNGTENVMEIKVEPKA